LRLWEGWKRLKELIQLIHKGGKDEEQISEDTGTEKKDASSGFTVLDVEKGEASRRTSDDL